MDRKLKEEIQNLIKKELDKEFKKQDKNIKKEYTEFVEDELKKINKTILTKKDIKDIIIKAFIQQSKFMWEKSGIVTQFINKV